ncbi:hypothetical protein EDD99_5643 [Streptomyces sp. 846.5]|nr:hypothetical protein [Streptomyces sp. 846.5]TDT97498.1 hypothetical protein EDD99_5643 [Streptomyces sp. 846.5]
MGSKKDNSLEIKGHASVSGGAFSVGDKSHAENTTYAAGAPASPQTIEELRAAVADFIVQLRAAGPEVAATVPIAEVVQQELDQTTPDGNLIERLFARIVSGLGSATVLTGAVTALVAAARALLGG